MRYITRFIALIHARNLEFFRDRSAFVWNIVFPVVLVVLFSFAFSDENKQLYKVGVLDGALAYQTDYQNWQGLRQTRYMAFIPYRDAQEAQLKLGQHRLDLLIAADGERYWVNPHSSNSYVAEKLLLAAETGPLKRYEVEGQALRYVDWVLPGIMGMNIMFSSLFGVGYVIVRYRKQGVLKRLQATPLRAGEFLAAQLLSRLLISVASVVVVFVGCHLVFHFTLLGSPLTLLLCGVLGSMAMISLGTFIAAITDSEETASGVLNMMTWPMLLLSEVWFSLEGAPQWLKMISQAFPLTHMVKAARAVMTDGAGLLAIWPSLAYLLVFSGVFLLVGAKFFRWQGK